MRILIVGAYGAFGGRLVELLEDEPRLTLLVGGRSVEHARLYCATRARALAGLVPTAFDRQHGTLAQLRALRADLVIDASGPFQAYGRTPYRLIEQCIECRIPYLDLADGSEFVTGVSRYDKAAREMGIFVLSGVSSVPVLSAAVVRRLSVDMVAVHSIRGGIAPSPFASVGSSVIRAIASYAGQPIALWRNGAPATGRALTESLHFTIAAPGHVPLRRRRFSLVDVPDLRLFPTLWPTLEQVWMGAAPVPAVLHRSLTGFAWLVRLHLLPGLLWLHKAMSWVMGHARWGEHRGGMFVEVAGQGADGGKIVREWHLLAEGDDGPKIPCMALESVVRNLLLGRIPKPGARAGIEDVSLTDYEILFARRSIHTGIRETIPARELPLFQRILGTSWPQLPSQIRQLHCPGQGAIFSGRCTVHRGRNPLAQLIARTCGFPASGSDRSMRITINPEADGERWIRSCDGRTFVSTQMPGRGSSEWLTRERFGPVTVHMALVVEGASLSYVIRRWTLFGVPLPLAWGPRTIAVESVQDNAFRFDVQISHPLTGLIVRYAGTLEPVVTQASATNASGGGPT